MLTSPSPKSRWLILVLVVIQFFLVNHMLSFRDVINQKLIINADYPVNYYNLVVSKSGLLEGKGVVYVPYFFGGYLNSVTYLDKMNDLTILSTILNFISTVKLFKFYVFFMNLLLPFLMYFAAKNFGLRRKECIIILLLSIIVWQFNNLLHQMIYSGVFSFIFSLYLSIFVISLWYQVLYKRRETKFLIFTIFITLVTVSMHSYSIFVFSIPLILMFLDSSREKDRYKKLLLVLVGCLLFTVLILKEYDYFFTNKDPPFFHQAHGFRTIYEDLTLKPIQTIIFLLGGFGIILFKKEKNGRLFTLFLFLSFFYFTFSYFGSYIYLISYFQPQRTLVALSLLLIIPSSKTILFAQKRLIQLYKKNKIFGISLSMFAVSILVLFLFNSNEVLGYTWKMRLTTEMPAEVEKLIDWMEENTSNQARVLIEDSGYKSNFVYGGHTISLFPLYTKREFIGGPYPYLQFKKDLYIPHFYEGTLFNHEVESFSLDDLKYFFDIYNIKWIIVWSERSKSTFNIYPDYLKKIKTIGNFTIYDVNREPNYFVNSTGLVDADLNKIKVSEAKDSPTILKYRYYPELEIEPKLKVTKYPIGEYKGKKILFSYVVIKNEKINEFELKFN